jgi:hypothetical protein
MAQPCSQKTLSGLPCRCVSAHVYEGRLLCTKHLQSAKAGEECCICFIEMKAKKRIKLCCGHYFHTECLSHCDRAVCPICRADISADQAYKIFENTVVKPTMVATLALPTDVHGFVFNGIHMLNDIASMGTVHSSLVHMLLYRFASSAKHVSPHVLCQIVGMLEGALAHAKLYDTMAGLTVICTAEGAVCASEQDLFV